MIVGAATLTAAVPAGRSIFDQADRVSNGGIRKTIDGELQRELLRLWDSSRPPARAEIKP